MGYDASILDERPGGAADRRAILDAIRSGSGDAFSAASIAARLALPLFSVQRALDELVRGGLAVLDDGEYIAADRH